jgi:hypothetical protein
MNVEFFSRAFVERLHDQAAGNLARYQTQAGWAGVEAREQGALHASQRVVSPPPQLKFGGGDETANDAANARLVHQWLGALPTVIAMDERLWAWAAHGVFADYMAARWPAKAQSAIHRRYLFEGSTFAALTRHGIARLWWAGQLTHDPERADPYQLTDVLFHRQDVHVSLLERAMGKCPSVRRGVLEFLLERQSELSEEAYGRRIQVLLRDLNLHGGVLVLDSLRHEQISAYLDRAAKQLFPPREAKA